MARKLVELARRSAAVRRVIAHTLPETNASTRVLEKVGMTFVGEVMDPEDGRVWRWQVQTGAAAEAQG
jgi:RimJ/RimL family protein N-acetyltransferase